MVPVPRDLLERLADHAAALSHSDTTQGQRDAARSDAEEADNVLSLAALTAPAPASGEVEIINPRGRVAYRRPLSHPDVLEALQRPGYSVRKSEATP